MVHFSFYLEGIPCQNDCGNNQRESGQDSQDLVDHKSRKNKELLVSGTNTAQAGRDQEREEETAKKVRTSALVVLVQHQDNPPHTASLVLNQGYPGNRGAQDQGSTAEGPGPAAPRDGDGWRDGGMSNGGLMDGGWTGG